MELIFIISTKPFFLFCTSYSCNNWDGDPANSVKSCSLFIPNLPNSGLKLLPQIIRISPFLFSSFSFFFYSSSILKNDLGDKCLAFGLDIISIPILATRRSLLYVIFIIIHFKERSMGSFLDTISTFTT